MEVDFPRGKSEVVTDKTKDKRKPLKRKRERNLFTTEKATPKKKKKKLAKSTEDGSKGKIQGTVDTQTSTKIDMLTTKTVTSGMVMLGCVSEIQDYKLIISLPYNMKGAVPITEVSDVYTSRLQQLADDELDEEEEVASLSEMFHIGMMVCCKVCDRDLEVKKKVLDLTLNPRLVYEGRSHKFLKNGTMVMGSVQSQEDHGYVIDIVITNAKGFLANKNCQEYIDQNVEGNSLLIGQLVWCKVKVKQGQEFTPDSVNSVHLDMTPQVIKDAVISIDTSISYNNLMPGVNVTGFIKKASEYGLIIRIGNRICLIHPTHVNGDPLDFNEDDQITAKVLYVHSESKTVYLTMLPHLMTYDGQKLDNQFEEFSVGDLVTGALVCEVVSKGVYLKLPHGATGLAPKGHLSDSPVKNIKDEFTIGSTYKCKIVGFNLIDNLIMVSLKQSILDQQLIRIRDIIPGQLFKVEVKLVTDNYLRVKIGDLKGIIPGIHMSDIPLKNPSKKFKEGDKLECRVLSVHTNENKVKFTNKKSLVESNLPIIHHFSQLRRNMEVEGFVAMVNDKGLLVVLYNEVKGWIPTGELSEEKIYQPEKVYYVGQVVRCRVKHLDEEKGKVIFSMKPRPEPRQPLERQPRQREISVSDQFEPGSTMKCQIKRKLKENFMVEDIESKEELTLHKDHLADFDDICQVLWDMLQPGDVLDKVVQFSCNKNINVTMKPSILKHIETDVLPLDFEDLSKDRILPGVIKNIVEYGIFFTLTGGLTGLVPTKMVSDDYMSYEEITHYLHVGQTVMIRVTYLDQEKKTVVGSMLTHHCFPRYPARTAENMNMYLENRDLAFKTLSTSHKCKDFLEKASLMPVGSVIQATVESVNNTGIICEITNGLKGSLTVDMLYGASPSVGDRIMGVVINVNISNQMLELCLDSDIIKAMKSTETEDHVQQLNVDQNIEAIILQVTSSYYLVSLRQKALGSMAYIPIQETLNSINQEELFSVNQKIMVKIHSVYNDAVIALVSANQKLPKQQVTPQPKKVTKPQLSVGGVFKSTIKTILPEQLELDIEGYKGVLHCTEVLDEIDNGQWPFQNMSVGDTLTVRVTGFSKKKGEDKAAECTTKPSQMSGRIPKVNKSFPLNSERKVFIKMVGKGDVVVSITPYRLGLISVFDLSHDLQILQNKEKHFQNGRGYNATVIGCRGRHKIIFSLTGHRQKTVVNETTFCHVTGVDTESREVTLQLPLGYKSTITLDSSKKLYSVGQWFKCRVLSVNKDNQTCEVKILKQK